MKSVPDSICEHFPCIVNGISIVTKIMSIGMCTELKSVCNVTYVLCCYGYWPVHIPIDIIFVTIDISLTKNFWKKTLMKTINNIMLFLNLGGAIDTDCWKTWSNTTSSSNCLILSVNQLTWLLVFATYYYHLWHRHTGR